MRSAAPLSIRHCPIIAASPIAIPISPAVRPNSTPTRSNFSYGSPGASTLTNIAAVISAKNALVRSTTISTRTVPMPIASMNSGCSSMRWKGPGMVRNHRAISPHKNRRKI